MNNENGNGNGAAVMQPQIEMFGGLFKADGELARNTLTKVSKSGSTRVGLLPMRSKAGDSLAKLSGFTGPALEAHRSRLQDEMKMRLGGIAGVFGASSEWTGSHLSLNSKGDRATLVFIKKQHVALSKDGVLSTLTEDGLMAELDKRAGVVPRAAALEA
jgi:hypothetical protein